MSWNSRKLITKYRSQGAAEIPITMRGVDHFDHLFAYTSTFDRPSDMVESPQQIRTTALWLTSYLAHWGMFRGSSNLKRMNVLFFDHLANALLNERTGLLCPFFNVNLENIKNLKKGTATRVLTSISKLLGHHGISPTATLVSKLILGCTHTVPGYDRYVCAGLKRLKSEEGYQGSAAFSESGLCDLSGWYEQQRWPTIFCAANDDLRIPSARLADMALSIYGGAK